MNTKTVVYCIVALLIGFLIFYLLKSVCSCNNIIEGQVSRFLDQVIGGGARMAGGLLESDAAENSVILGGAGGSGGLRGNLMEVENTARVATGSRRLTEEEYNEEFNRRVDRLTARWQQNHIGELMFRRAQDEICEQAGNFASWIGQDTDMDNVETADICVDITNSVFDCTSAVIQIAFPESQFVTTQGYMSDVGEIVTSSMEAGSEYATNRNILNAMDKSNLSVSQKLAKKAHAGRVVNSVMSCNQASTYKAWRETNADRLNIPGCYGSYLPDETEDQPSNYKDCHSEYLRRKQFGQTTDIADIWCINKSGCNLVKKISPCKGDGSSQDADELCTIGYNRVLNNTYSNDPNIMYREANRWCNDSGPCRLDQSQADTNLSEEIQVNDYSSKTIKDINPIFLEHMLTSHDIIIEIRRYLNEENHPDIINLKGDNYMDVMEIINRISNTNGLNNSTLLIKETVLGNEDQRAEISQGLIDLDLTGSLSHNGHIDASTSIDSISDPTSETEVSNNDISESIDRLLKQYKYLIYKYRGNTELIRTKLNNFFPQNIESERVNNVADNLSNLFNNSDMLDNALYSRILDHWLDTLPRHMNPYLNLFYEHAKRLLGITNMDRATEAAEEMEDKIERFMSAGPTADTAYNAISSGIECGGGIKDLISKFRGRSVAEAGEEVAESASIFGRATKIIGSLGPAAACGSDIVNLFQNARNTGILTFTNMSNMIRYTHYIQNFCKVLDINNDVIHNGTLGMIKVGKPRHTGDPIDPMEEMVDPGKMTLGQTPPIGSILIDSSFNITEDNIEIMNEGHNNQYEIGDEVSLFYVPERNPDRFWVLLSIISYLKQFVTIFETMGFLPSNYDQINSELPNLISSAESAEQVPGNPSQQSDSSSAPPPPSHPCDVITTDSFSGDTGTFTNSVRNYCKQIYDSNPALNCNVNTRGNMMMRGYRDWCIQDNQRKAQIRQNALDPSKYIKYYNTVNDITGSRFSDDESRDIGTCLGIANGRQTFHRRDILESAGAWTPEMTNTLYDGLAYECIANDNNNNIVSCYTSCSALAEGNQTDIQEFIQDSLENDRITQDQLQQTTRIYEQLSIDGQPSTFQTIVDDYIN